MRPALAPCAALVCALASSPGAAEDPSPGEYERAIAESEREENAGDPAAAAATLAAALPDYPQDFPLHLQYAYALLLAGRYPEARLAYAAALALSPTSEDALRGQSEARRRVGTGAAWLRLVPQLYFTAQSSGGASDGTRTNALAMTTGLDALIADHWLLSARYRRLASLSTATGQSAFAQDEVHLSAAYVRDTFSVALHAGFLSYAPEASSGSSTSTAVLVAASGHFRRWADLSGSLAYTAYSDAGVGQLELGAALPLRPWLSLFGGARVQATSSGAYGAALTELRFHDAQGGGWSATVGGELGPQYCPVDLASAVLYDQSGERLLELHTSVAFPIAGPIEGFAAYQYERDQSTDGNATQSDVHRVTAGVSVAF